MSATQYYGTGRRKSSTARVFLQNGEGNITVRKLKVYAGDSHPHAAQQPELLQL